MLLANCQIMFPAVLTAGRSSLWNTRLAKISSSQPIRSGCDFPRRQQSQRSTGLAAAYVRVGTRMAAGPSGHLVVWRYRFLSYCTPFVGEVQCRPPQPADRAGTLKDHPRRTKVKDFWWSKLKRNRNAISGRCPDIVSAPVARADGADLRRC